MLYYRYKFRRCIIIKIYTAEVKRLSINNLNPNFEALKDIAFESTVVKKNALFYVNFLGVLISFDYNTKLLNRDEAEFYLTNYAKSNPKNAHLVSCIYKDNDEVFSHEISKAEFKRLIKAKKNERKKNTSK